MSWELQRRRQDYFSEFISTVCRRKEGLVVIKDLAGSVICEVAGESLVGADLRRLKLWRADFRAKNLSGADMAYADCSGADFTDANLSGVNLSNSTLKKTILVRADLRGADLERADLEGANIEGAKINGDTRTFKLRTNGAKGGWVS